MTPREGKYHTCRFCGDKRSSADVLALADPQGLATYACPCGKTHYVRYDMRERDVRVSRPRKPYKKRTRHDA